MRVVITSDWHFDAVTHGVRRASHIERAVCEILESVDGGAFVFAGDLCDPGVRAPRAMAKMLELATRRLRGSEQIWVAGNHDVVADGDGTTVLDVLESLDLPAVEVVKRPGLVKMPSGLCIAAFPFVERALMYDPVEEVRRMAAGGVPDLVVGHLDVPGALLRSETYEMARGGRMVLPVEAIRSEWGDVPVVNGHYHAQQVTPDEVCIPGSPVRLSFSEAGNSPGYLMASEVGGRLEVEQRSLRDDGARFVEVGCDGDLESVRAGDFVRTTERWLAACEARGAVVMLRPAARGGSAVAPGPARLSVQQAVEEELSERNSSAAVGDEVRGYLGRVVGR